MSYDKLDLKGFQKKLANKEYETATGARRAVGKVQWPDADKNKARNAINKHFGDNSGAPEVAAPKATKPAKKLAAVKAPKKLAAVKASKTPALSVPAAVKAPKAQKAAKAPVKAYAADSAAPMDPTRMTMAQLRMYPLAQAQLAHSFIAAASDALRGYDVGKGVPGADVSEVQQALNVIAQATLVLARSTREILGLPAEDQPTKPAPASKAAVSAKARVTRTPVAAAPAISAPDAGEADEGEDEEDDETPAADEGQRAFNASLPQGLSNNIGHAPVQESARPLVRPA